MSKKKKKEKLSSTIVGTGNFNELKASKERIHKKVLKVIRNSEDPVTYRDIAQSSTLDSEVIRNSLLELKNLGKIGKKYQDNEWMYFSTKKPKEKKKESDLRFSEKYIHVLRGGDWKVEGNQSVFYYKVKVKNDSKLIIININILITSIPRGLDLQSNNYRIESLKPDSFESPTFKFSAKESCVGDKVEGIVTFTDPSGTLQTVQIEPFEICYVCNLLSPKSISKEEFDKKVGSMEKQQLIIESSLDASELEAKIAEVIKNCNFAMLQDMKASQDNSFTKLEAFAEGLYDKQDVALSVAVRKVESGTELVIEAMSDRAEKVTDLLRDFNVKLDDIKSDVELIKEYSPQIELILDKQEDMEAFLKARLAKDWEKVKGIWQNYKDGKINKAELIKSGIKLIGKKFVKKIVGRVYL